MNKLERSIQLVRAGQAIEQSRRLAFTNAHPNVTIANGLWNAVPLSEHRELVTRYTSINVHEQGYSTNFQIPERGPLEAHSLTRGHITEAVGTFHYCLHCREGQAS